MPPYLRASSPLLTAAVVIATLGACDDPLRPRDVAGTYVLRSVRGDPLPAVVRETNQSQLRVLADSLYLNRDGTGREVWVLESTGPYASGPEHSERSLTFQTRGGRLEGTYPCGPLEICVGVIALRGDVTPSGLRLDVNAHASGPLVFERVHRWGQ
jgi:hypothetical protein